ncbi:hypothetical protein NPIL_532031 [Nephila pilipes]|uniref:Nucleolar protein 10 n=1 Tax=Nephila pilipes TaxID=299642 RepID=A0A8X6PMH3_NEPPI|nr:hypothetical protein NPIL_532031 [Nephila pilipes]
MYLMYYIDEKGDRVYTLKSYAPDGKPTLSAHPARFSPADAMLRCQQILCGIWLDINVNSIDHHGIQWNNNLLLMLSCIFFSLYILYHF